MRKHMFILQIFIVMALTLSLVGFAAPPMARGLARAQAELLQVAAVDPDQPVSVIVQALGPLAQARSLAEHFGARVVKNLDLINAFSAEMNAGVARDLALYPLVRWISLDAPTRSMLLSPTFTSWATAIGTEEVMALTNAPNLIDSFLGPNLTYAIGLDGKKGSVTGFQIESTPGNTVAKVEALLVGYVPSIMAHDFKIKVWLGGNKIKDFNVVKELWTPYFGASNIGTVAIDITSARAWNWADLENRLAISFDFGPFDPKDALALDAVGLRVTSQAGIDSITDSGGDTSALASIITTQQVNVYNQVIRSSDLWNTAAKLQGKGVTIGVVDSGVFKAKDLDKRIRANVNFNKSYHDAADRYGHGTFVASIIGGNGSQSAGKYIGVAPRADLLNLRISDGEGMSFESDIIEALQWALNNKSKYNIRIVNLSVNSAVAQSYHTSPLCAAVEVLWFNNIVVVVAAGNNGTATLFPPANDPFVITVGATDDRGTVDLADDLVASFSAYGVTEWGAAKPELVAPGRNIIGLLPENDKLNMSKLRLDRQVDKSYFRMSGTSVSAPMVSGAVAILLQDEPTLTPDQVKYRLMATANKSWPGYNAAKAGAGYLDIYAAVNGTTTESANTGLNVSTLLTTGTAPVNSSVAWNSVAWNSVAWNSVAWNSVAWNSVAWNSIAWNSDYWGD